VCTGTLSAIHLASRDNDDGVSVDRRSGINWTLEVSRHSLKKRAKVNAIRRMLPRVVHRCLEVGSDAGYVGLCLRDLGGRWTHLESDPVRREAAGRILANVRSMSLDPPVLPEPLDAFDTVVAADIIEHVNDDRGLLEECRRVMTPDGRIIVTTPARNKVIAMLRRMAGLSDRSLGHVRPGYSRTELEALLVSAGFTPEACISFGGVVAEVLDILAHTCYRLVANRRDARPTLGPEDRRHFSRLRPLWRMYLVLWPIIEGLDRLESLVGVTGPLAWCCLARRA